MGLRKDTNDSNSNSQLSNNQSGLRSFDTPDDIAKGGGSQLQDSDFGTLAGSERRRAQSGELRQQMHLNRKKERAVRLGYRNLIKKGRGGEALKLLNDAEKGGTNPFGIRQEGQRAREASTQITGRRSSEIRAGARQINDDDFFQRDLRRPGHGVAAAGNQNVQPQNGPAILSGDAASQDTFIDPNLPDTRGSVAPSLASFVGKGARPGPPDLAAQETHFEPHLHDTGGFTPGNEDHQKSVDLMYNPPGLPFGRVSGSPAVNEAPFESGSISPKAADPFDLDPGRVSPEGITIPPSTIGRVGDAPALNEFSIDQEAVTRNLAPGGGGSREPGRDTSLPPELTHLLNQAGVDNDAIWNVVDSLKSLDGIAKKRAVSNLMKNLQPK